MQHTNHLFWLDLEMTGLDENTHHIIEIASIITDASLNLVAEGPVIAIHHSDTTLNLMDDWNKQTHGESGLINRIKESNYTVKTAETATLSFIQKWIPKGTSPLCGNSIGTDRRFLKKYMPSLNEYCHYRNIDVSSFKEMIKRWYPNDPQYQKRNTHKAMDDIRESIEELRFYRQHYFVNHYE